MGLWSKPFSRAASPFFPSIPSRSTVSDDRHSMSGAKDDRRDAFVLADALRTDGHRFQRLKLPPPEIIAMRGLLIAREQLIKNHVALSSQIRDLLVRCWPHLSPLLHEDKALDSFFCELLQLFFDDRPKPSSSTAIHSGACQKTPYPTGQDRSKSSNHSKTTAPRRSRNHRRNFDSSQTARPTITSRSASATGLRPIPRNDGSSKFN